MIVLAGGPPAAVPLAFAMRHHEDMSSSRHALIRLIALIAAAVLTLSPIAQHAADVAAATESGEIVPVESTVALLTAFGIWTVVCALAAVALGTRIALIAALPLVVLASFAMITVIVMRGLVGGPPAIGLMPWVHLAQLLLVGVFVGILLRALLRGSAMVTNDADENGLRAAGRSGGPAAGTRSRNIWIIALFVVGTTVAVGVLVALIRVALTWPEHGMPGVRTILEPGIRLAIGLIVVALGVRSLGGLLASAIGALVLGVGIATAYPVISTALFVAAGASVALFVLELRHRHAARAPKGRDDGEPSEPPALAAGAPGTADGADEAATPTVIDADAPPARPDIVPRPRYRPPEV